MADRCRADGGEEADEEDLDRSNVEITEAGESEPADPKWEKPDIDDIPEFEVRADAPVATGPAGDDTTSEGADPTAGMPNTARSPDQSRIAEADTEGYIVALELCARLPDDIRLPEEAADLVPAAVEAELEDDIRSFAAAEFGAESPHVDELSFVDTDDGIWLRLRLGVSPAVFADLEPAKIRAHALEELEGLF